MIGNTLFVDKTLGDDEHGRAFHADKPFLSLEPALEVGRKLNDAIVINIAPGVYTCNLVEVFDNLTINGAGESATQIYTTISTRKLKGNCCIKNVTLINTQAPILLALGPGVLELSNVKLFGFAHTPDATLAVLYSGIVMMRDFAIIFTTARNGPSRIWTHLGGELQLFSGSQQLQLLDIVNVANVQESVKIKTPGIYHLTGNMKCSLHLRESDTVTLHQVSGTSTIDNLTLEPGDTCLVTRSPDPRATYRSVKIPTIYNIIPVIHAIDSVQATTIVAGNSHEIGYQYLSILEIVGNGGSGKIRINKSNFCSIITNNSKSDYTMRLPDKKCKIPGNSKCAVIGVNGVITSYTLVPSKDIALQRINVIDKITGSDRKVDYCVHTVVGDISTRHIDRATTMPGSGSYVYQLDAPIKGQSIPVPLTFVTPTSNLNFIIGNPNYLSYVALPPAGYTFYYDGVKQASLDLSKRQQWTIQNSNIVDELAASSDITMNVAINNINSITNIDVGKNNKLLVINHGNVKIGTNGWTVENSSNMEMAVLDNSNSRVVMAGVVNI